MIKSVNPKETSKILRKSFKTQQSYLSESERRELFDYFYLSDNQYLSESNNQLKKMGEAMGENQTKTANQKNSQDSVAALAVSGLQYNQAELGYSQIFNEDMAAMLEFLLYQFEGEVLDKEAISFISGTMQEISNYDNSGALVKHLI